MIKNSVSQYVLKSTLWLVTVIYMCVCVVGVGVGGINCTMLSRNDKRPVPNIDPDCIFFPSFSYFYALRGLNVTNIVAGFYHFVFSPRKGRHTKSRKNEKKPWERKKERK